MRSPECYGILTFTDGTTEPIFSVEWITKMCFTFTTTSGLYCYEKVVDFPEVSYFDNRKYLTANVEHCWAKAVAKPELYYDRTEWHLDWERVFNIQQVFLRDEMILVRP